MFGQEIDQMRNARLCPSPPRGRRDMHQAAGVVRRHNRASRLRDRIQLPFREPVGHTRPLEAEAATEAAAVGDVRDVDDLVARQLEYAPGLAFQPALAQRLAGIVVWDLQAL